MIGRFSTVKDITELEVGILKYLRECSDKPSRMMWQETAYIKRDLKRRGFDLGKFPGAMFKLQREPECLRVQKKEPTTTQTLMVYRINREGRMVLLDVENGTLVPKRSRPDKSKWAKKKKKKAVRA